MSIYIKSKHPKQNFKYMIKFLRYIIPAIVEYEVGLANLEAELLQTHTVGGNHNSCICI